MFIAHVLLPLVPAIPQLWLNLTYRETDTGVILYSENAHWQVGFSVSSLPLIYQVWIFQWFYYDMCQWFCGILAAFCGIGYGITFCKARHHRLRWQRSATHYSTVLLREGLVYEGIDDEPITVSGECGMRVCMCRGCTINRTH